MTVSRCTVSGNAAATDGGGFYVGGIGATINKSTLSGNSAVGKGGGLYCASAFGFSMNQCTVAGNNANGGPGNNGGGIFDTSQSYMLHCTLSGNQGGGLLVSSSTTSSLYNSIVAGNDINITTISSGLNPALTYSGVNITSGDPMLAPLGYYGGTTQTMPPVLGSPAIDTTTNAPTFNNDQRGFPCPADGNDDSIAVADIGAVELISNWPVTLGGMKKLGNGTSQFSFLNSPGQSFTVFASPDLAAPLDTWTPVGSSVEAPAGSGQYQFTDSNATNNPSRFYRVRSP